MLLPPHTLFRVSIKSVGVTMHPYIFRRLNARRPTLPCKGTLTGRQSRRKRRFVDGTSYVISCPESRIFRTLKIRICQATVNAPIDAENEKVLQNLEKCSAQNTREMLYQVESRVTSISAYSFRLSIK